MNEQRALDATELRLRAALVDLRPTDGAPATLRVRVAAVPDRLASQGIGARIRALATAPAALALVASAAAVLIVAANVGRLAAPGTIGPGAGTSQLDPTLAGAGIVRFAIPALQVAGGLSMLAALVLGLRWRSIGGFESWRDMGRGALLIALVAVPALLLVEAPLRDYGGSGGASLGAGVWVNPPPGADAPEARYVTAERGAPVIVFFDVTNGSALPVTLNGIVVGDATAGTGLQWTAAGLASFPNTFPNSVEQLRPFTPQELAPGDRVTLYLVGKAGSCAFGPTFTIDSPVTQYEAVDPHLQLSYSILGLASSSTFTMPMRLVQPNAPPCG